MPTWEAKMDDLTGFIAKEEEKAYQELGEVLGGTEGDDLKIVDLAILTFLGSQVVLPIVCSFVQQELWERFKRIRTEKQAREARAELQSSTLGEAVADRDTVLGEIIDGLTEEGVPAKDAARIAQQHYRRVQERVGVAGS